MDVKKYGFENLRRTQSIDWRIMVLEEGFWGVTKKEGIGFLKIKFYEKVCVIDLKKNDNLVKTILIVKMLGFSNVFKIVGNSILWVVSSVEKSSKENFHTSMSTY
ncbi:transmembrane protein, putative [Medicago truncatula]|uniref:Transmembrane protein, putative n=1 Tax=Medicago truncatula TaxID=3880 RepID=A0A072UL32_MEDTR|nr:transmembrane protein, putative [Medicago truncatula]